MRILIATSVVLAAGCQTIRLDSPVRPGPDDWITTGASAAHNPWIESTVHPPLVRVWEYNAEAAFGPGGAVIVGDVLLVGTRRGEVHAVDLEKGKKSGSVKFKEPIEGTPVVYDGTLYLTTSWGNRTMFGFDLERGRRQWSEKGDPVVAGPVLVDETLVLATVAGEVSGRDPADGAIRWIAGAAGSPISSTPVSMDDGTVVVADQRGLVRAIRTSDGSEVWAADAGAPVYAALTWIGGLVTVPTTRGRLLALDGETGRIEWHYTVPDGRVQFAPASGDERTIVFAATDGQVRAVDPRDGSLLWMASLPDAMNTHPLITGDVVWIGTMGRELVALDTRDGAILWTREMPGRIRSTLIPHDGGIIVLSEPRTITYLKPGEDADDE